MLKLSIVIPVYNIERYLPCCLDSILNQDFSDFEIICINDGSKDGSLEVLKSYKQKDNRIIIVDKANEGSGVARNYGLNIARGEFVYFVDGDDSLIDGALSKIVQVAEDNYLDILIFGAYSCYDKIQRKGSYSVDRLPKKFFNRLFSLKDIKSDIFKFPTTAWTKLYRREFLIDNNVKFQEIKVGQDQLLFCHSFIKAERIMIYPENIYRYRKNREGSVTSTKFKCNYSPIYVFDAIEKLLKSENLTKEYESIFLDTYFSKATSWLGKFDEKLKPDYYKEYMKLLAHIQKEYPFGWWVRFNPEISDTYGSLKLKQFIAKVCNFVLR